MSLVLVVRGATAVGDDGVGKKFKSKNTLEQPVMNYNSFNASLKGRLFFFLHRKTTGPDTEGP